MQSRTFTFAALATIAAQLVSAESSPLQVMNTRSASALHFTSWTESGDVITAGSSGATFTIQDDTTLKTSDGKYVAIGQDQALSLVDSADDAAKGWSIGETEGSLTPLNYNGQNSFVGCPSSSGSGYTMYFGNTADGCLGVNSWAEVSDDDSSSSASSSAAPSSGYYNTTSTAVVSDIATTVVTITSCSDNACSTGAVTTGVTVVTSTENGVQTVYTTYCPLTSETPAATSLSTIAPTAESTTASVEVMTGGANALAGATFGAFGAAMVAMLI